MTVKKKPFPDELIDALLGDYKKPEDLMRDWAAKATHQSLVGSFLRKS